MVEMGKGVFSKFIEKIALSYIAKELSKQKKAFVNTGSAKTVAVLFEYDDFTDLETLRYINKEFNKINIVFFQIINDKKIQPLYNKSLAIRKNQFNFFYKPKQNTEFHHSIKKEFDILFDLTSHQSLLTYCTAAYIKARMKVCRFKKNNSFYSLMIKLNEKQKSEELVYQSISYLNKFC